MKESTKKRTLKKHFLKAQSGINRFEHPGVGLTINILFSLHWSLKDAVFSQSVLIMPMPLAKRLLIRVAWNENGD